MSAVFFLTGGIAPGQNLVPEPLSGQPQTHLEGGEGHSCSCHLPLPHSTGSSKHQMFHTTTKQPSGQEEPSGWG